MITGPIVLVAVIASAALLLRPSVRGSTRWRATMTPLASIIGSGFLVVTPLLASVAGSWAPVAMGAIVVLAYWVGSAIRFSISEIEPRLETDPPWRLLVDLDRLSRLLLGFAYVVSVAFYVRLMASFVLRAAGDGELAAQFLTTGVLAAIGAIGWMRDLHGLEMLEEVADDLKLPIIAGLVVGLIVFNAGDASALVSAYRGSGVSSDAWSALRILAGMLLVVQGFETSRYLGAHYDRPTRIASMRDAQLLSAGIYVVFVALGVGAFFALPVRVDETAVLDIAIEVTPLLGPLLVIAAIASQLSAAVADTAGGGEMLTGSARSAPSSGVGYAAVTGGAIAIVWLADVFAIISFASRAFAAYYFTQTLMAVIVLIEDRAIERRRRRIVLYVPLLVVLGFVTIFALPADG